MIFAMFRNVSGLVIFYDLFHQLNLGPDPTHLPMYFEVQQLVKKNLQFLSKETKLQ